MKNLFRKLYLRHKKGFSLLEILVVLIILGVLATIAIPTYQKVIRKSRVSDGLHNLDILANSQEKYFIENNQYAKRLSALKVPVKELHLGAGGNDIITTSNFVYSKDFADDCIKARAEHDGRYTLVKNYKLKSKVSCVGEGCGHITDYVEEAANVTDVCPHTNACELSVEECAPKHFWESICQCGCDEEDYTNCDGILDPDTCECVSPGPGGSGCSPEGATFPTGDYITGPEGECTYVEQGVNYCGIKRPIIECEHLGGPWVPKTICLPKDDYCHSLGMVLNPATCQCETLCDENLKPNCDGTGYTTCDPCPNAMSLSGVILQILAVGHSSGECLHCGYKQTIAGEPYCENGQWFCPGAGTAPCQAVSADPINGYTDCDGGFPGNTCGQNTLNNIRCFQEIAGGIPQIITDYSTCELKDGMACFSGDYRPCEIPGQTGIQICEDCRWADHCVANACDFPGACEPGSTRPCEDPAFSQTCTDECLWTECEVDCADPKPQDYYSPYNCGMYRYFCENHQWVPHFTPSGNNQCDNGDTMTCQDGSVITCENCMWPNCPGETSCEGEQLIIGQTDANGNTNYKKCDDGRPGEFCGVQTTFEQICVDNNWLWDFTNSPCVGGDEGGERPEGDPEPVPSNHGCFYREQTYECRMNTNHEAYWATVSAGHGWVPAQPGNDCENGLFGYAPNNEQFCRNCRLYKCPEGAVKNDREAGCFVQGQHYNVYMTQYRSSWWRCQPNRFPLSAGTQPGYLKACKATNSTCYYALGPCEQQNETEVICYGQSRLMYLTEDRRYENWRDYCGNFSNARDYAWATVSSLHSIGYSDRPETCSAHTDGEVCVPEIVAICTQGGWYVCEEVDPVPVNQ